MHLQGHVFKRGPAAPDLRLRSVQDGSWFRVHLLGFRFRGRDGFKCIPPSASRAELTRLTAEEAAVYQALRGDSYETAVRLEQELIGWDWALERLRRSTR